MDVEGFLDEPVAEVKIKPWHILALLGVGGIVAYFIFRDKLAPHKEKPAPAPAAPPATTSGLSGYASLGDQNEPVFEGDTLLTEVRKYSDQGWTVFKIPTGEENVMKNRERFEVHKVFAAPPGRPIPKNAERISV